MRVEGTYIFPGAIDRVFGTLTNPDALARAIPGCERFIQFGPPSADGRAAYETRLRLGERRQLYVVTTQITTAREPDYLRLELRGQGPSGAMNGSGSLDLVEQDGYTVVAYRLTLSGPDLPEGADEATRVAGFMARAACAHLADEIHAETEREPIWFPGAGLTTKERAALDLPSAGTPSWPERAVWMGAGLALGLGAIALTIAFARRLGERDNLTS